MFAVKITEWIFSLKSLGLLTWTCSHLPIVWDKVPNKFVFFLTPSLIYISSDVACWQWDGLRGNCDISFWKFEQEEVAKQLIWILSLNLVTIKLL